ARDAEAPPPAGPDRAPARPSAELPLHPESPGDDGAEEPILDPETVHRPHHLDGARLENRRAEAEQRLVEATEVTRRSTHPAAGFDLGDEVGLVVVAVDLVRDHLQPAVRFDDGQDVTSPRHASVALAAPPPL